MESAAGTFDDSCKMPHKVVAVAAGEAHTLALSGNLSFISSIPSSLISIW